ncbi:MAG: hypothetical protein V6Z86_04615 [Hyphomicrobiales bacterium]
MSGDSLYAESSGVESIPIPALWIGGLIPRLITVGVKGTPLSIDDWKIAVLQGNSVLERIFRSDFEKIYDGHLTVEPRQSYNTITDGAVKHSRPVGWGSKKRKTVCGFVAFKVANAPFFSVFEDFAL